jgi:dienelactone hydrolase
MSQPVDSPPRHRWFLLHLLGRGVALGMRIVPRRHRFGAALFLSRIMRPIIRLTTAYREHRANSSDTDREVALHHLLRVMTEHGTPFDLGWIVEGHDEVCEALASTRGVLFAAPHAMLATLTSRYVYDLGRIPTVIALHGCGGLGGQGDPIAPRYREWAEQLLKAGYAVLLPDSFASREVGPQCREKERKVLARRERVADIAASHKWLAAQNWVAHDRISLIGWAHGASAVLWAVRPQLGTRGKEPDYRSAIAFYPECRISSRTGWSARVPTLLLIGANDDVASPPLCKQMVDGARGRSALARIVVYPDARHAFERVGFVLAAMMPRIFGMRCSAIPFAQLTTKGVCTSMISFPPAMSLSIVAVLLFSSRRDASEMNGASSNPAIIPPTCEPL